MNAGRRVWDRIGFVVAGVVAIYLIIHAFEPSRLNWGDPVSDFNVMIAGRNFARYGFANLHFTPLLIDKSVMTPRDSVMIYTHYPQIPDLANGLLRSFFGLSTLSSFRLVALAFSAGSLFFAFQLVRDYWGVAVAQIALALWVLNPLWVQHADYLHHGPYAFFFGFGALYFTRRSFERRGFAWLAGAFLGLAFLSSYDVWIFAPLVMATMVTGEFGAVWRKPALRILAIGAGFAVGAIALKLATNAWALGGVSSMIRDFRYQLSERATDAVVRTDFATGMLPTLLGRIEREFTLLFFAVTVYWAALALRRTHQKAPVNAINPIVILLAALPFLAIFRELWVAQYYPLLMLVPFCAIGTAILLEAGLRAERRMIRLAAAAGLIAIVASSIDETVRFPRAFISDRALSSLQQQIPKYTRPGQRILTNLIVDSPYRYYLDRNNVPLLVHESFRLPSVIQYFADPAKPDFSSPDGATLLLHKNIRAALFDKGYYYILAPYHLWEAWGQPERYRPLVDSIVSARDSTLLRIAQAVGQKLYESDEYSLWNIPPAAHWPRVSSGTKTK